MKALSWLPCFGFLVLGVYMTLEILNVTTEQISQIPTAQIGRTEEDEQHYKEKESYIVQHDKATPPEKCENGQDFASTSSGASIIAHSKSIIHGDGIILKEKDRYMLYPSTAENQWLVVSFREDILISTYQFINSEQYSPNLKYFRLEGSVEYPTENWIDLGIYKASDEKGWKTFSVPQSTIRYLNISFISYHDIDTHYCTMNQIKVFGSTVVERMNKKFGVNEVNDTYVDKMDLDNLSRRPKELPSKKEHHPAIIDIEDNEYLDRWRAYMFGHGPWRDSFQDIDMQDHPDELTGQLVGIVKEILTWFKDIQRSEGEVEITDDVYNKMFDKIEHAEATVKKVINVIPKFLNTIAILQNKLFDHENRATNMSNELEISQEREKDLESRILRMELSLTEYREKISTNQFYFLGFLVFLFIIVLVLLISQIFGWTNKQMENDSKFGFSKQSALESLETNSSNIGTPTTSPSKFDNFMNLFKSNSGGKMNRIKSVKNLHMDKERQKYELANLRERKSLGDQSEFNKVKSEGESTE